MSLGIVQILILLVIIGVIATPFIVAKNSRNKKVTEGKPVKDLPPYKWGYAVAIVIGGINGSLVLLSSFAQFNIIGIILGLLLICAGYGVFQRYRYAWVAAIGIMGLAVLGLIMQIMDGALGPAIVGLIATGYFFIYSCYYLYSRWQEFHPFSYRGEPK